MNMILQAQTSRWLSWAGLVAGVGLFLLAPIAVQAQAPKDPFQAQPTQKESVDQQIEILKKAIQILEQQKAGDKGKPAPKQADPAEIKKAEEDLAAITKQMEIKRGELTALQQKYAIAARRLAELRGGKVTDGKTPQALYFEWKQPGHKQEFNYKDTLKEVLKHHMSDEQGGQAKYPVEVIRDKKSGQLLLDAMKKKSSGDGLEQKLDRLMKEVEELRREIKQQKSPRGALLPAQPSAIYTVPATPAANALPATTVRPAVVTPPATPTTSQPSANTVPTTPAKK